MHWIKQIGVENNFLNLSKVEEILAFTSDQPLVADSFKTYQNIDIDIGHFKKTKKLPKKINSILLEIDLKIQEFFRSNNCAQAQSGYSLEPTLMTIEQTITSRPYKTDFSTLFSSSQDLGEPREAGNLGYKPRSDTEWLESFDGGFLNNFKFKASIFLNEDFLGGHTSFPIQKCDVEPKVGKLLLHPFSRDYVYAVRRVKNGARFALNLNYELIKK